MRTISSAVSKLAQAQRHWAPGMQAPQIGQPSDKSRSEDILVWALWSIGGADAPVDVEAIYLECFKIAPTRFAWRTRPDIPDLKKCAKALQGAEAKTHIGAMARHGAYHRMLTPQGIAWCNQHSGLLMQIYGGDQKVSTHAADFRTRLVREVRSEESFRSWLTTGTLPEAVDLADAFRCSAGSSRATWAARATQLLAAAQSANDLEVERFALEVHERFGAAL